MKNKYMNILTKSNKIINQIKNTFKKNKKILTIFSQFACVQNFFLIQYI